MLTRRSLFTLAALIAAKPTPRPLSDKDRLLAMLDHLGCVVADPASDGTKNAISVAVDGSNVTGFESGEVIFAFDKRGRLDHLVVWRADMASTGGST